MWKSRRIFFNDSTNHNKLNFWSLMNTFATKIQILYKKREKKREKKQNCFISIISLKLHILND